MCATTTTQEEAGEPGLLLLSDWLGVSVAASGQEDNICPFILSFVFKKIGTHNSGGSRDSDSDSDSD